MSLLEKLKKKLRDLDDNIFEVITPHGSGEKRQVVWVSLGGVVAGKDFWNYELDSVIFIVRRSSGPLAL